MALPVEEGQGVFVEVGCLVYLYRRGHAMGVLSLLRLCGGRGGAPGCRDCRTGRDERQGEGRVAVGASQGGLSRKASRSPSLKAEG
jgi:hypothetical protein